MDRRERRRVETNRRMWDESVGLHVAAPAYQVPAFLAGRTSLRSLEIEELGSVRGQSLLHLQCHFGLDTMSWARLGARVTGVDFAPEAVRAARKLALQAGISARFVRSEVEQLPRHLRGRFDIVYTGKGALCWLPELAKWGRVVSHFLKPGGSFYLLEAHPFTDIFPSTPRTRSLVPKIDYFRRTPNRSDQDGTYAAPNAHLTNRTSYDWAHPISEVIGALIDAGLRIDFVHEFPYTFWQQFPFLQRGDDGWWHLPSRYPPLPMMWSVRASRPNSP